MPIVIVGDNRLVLDGLMSVVGAGINVPARCAANIEDAITLASSLPSPVLCLFDYDVLVRETDLLELGGRLPEGALYAVYGAPAVAFEAKRLLKMGYHGYMPRSMTASAIICATQLLLRGERFVPAIALDVRGGARTPPRTRGECLSPRQRQILALVATGASNKHIARALAVEEVTVKSHIKAIFRKLDVRTRTEAARFAYNNVCASPARAQ